MTPIIVLVFSPVNILSISINSDSVCSCIPEISSLNLNSIPFLINRETPPRLYLLGIWNTAYTLLYYIYRS